MTTLATNEIAPAHAGTYTADEFEEMAEFDEGCELIDGRIVKKVSTGDAHGLVCFRIIQQFVIFDPQNEKGLFWPGTSVKIGPQNMPIPDLLFIVASRVPKKRSKKALRVIPNLAIEVLSPRDYRSQKTLEDWRSKVRMYQVVGVSIVWVINPDDKTVEIYHKGQLEPVQVLGVKDELSGEDVIPGFKLAVNKLFE